MQSNKNKKLIAYSSAAIGFITLNNDVSSQVLYTNIDPDENLYAYDQLQIDINDDGFIDIGIEAHLALSFTYSYYQGWSTSTLGIYFYANNFSAIVKAPFKTFSNLKKGFKISSSKLNNFCFNFSE